jgi:S-adenosylhomocysteine hydrolase
MGAARAMAGVKASTAATVVRSVNPLELLKRVVGKALPAQSKLEQRLKQAIDSRALDSFATSGPERFAADVAKRASAGQSFAAVQWLSIDANVPFAIASVLSELTAPDGTIDAAAVEKRYGADVAALVREAATAPPTGREVALEDYPGVEVTLQRIDPKLLGAFAKAKGQPERLPVIQKCVDALKGERPFEGMNAVMVQHMLGTQVELLSALEAAGLDPKNCTLMGRGYSDSKVVLSLARDKHYTVYDTAKSGLGGYEAQQEQLIRKALEQAIARAKTNGKPILVLDDGGLAAKMIHREFPQYASLFRGVEQTSRGITELKKLKALSMPVVDVARSPAKRIEALFIDDAAGRRLLTDLQALSREDVKGKKAVVYGYGPIGASVAHGLRALGADVTISDPVDGALETAAADGFAVAKDAHELLKSADLVMGCSGHRSVGPDELDLLKDGVIVASCSSAEVEIDNAYLGANGSSHVLPRRGGYESNHESHEIHLGGRRLVLLNRGFPMNFDGAVNSVRPEDIQLTQGLMFIAAVQSVKAAGNGLIPLDGPTQERVVADFNAVRTAAPPTAAQTPADPVRWPEVKVGLNGEGTVWNGELARLAQHSPGALSAKEAALIPSYPGLNGALWVDARSDDRFVLPGLKGEPFDLRAVGGSLLVWTVDASRQRHLQVYDRPPVAVDASDSIHARTATASLRATLPESDYSLVGGTVAGAGGAPEGVAALVHRDAQGDVRFLDLGNGESGAIQGLPSLDGHAVRVLAGKGVLFDETAATLHFLSGPDARAVRSSVDLGRLGLSQPHLFFDTQALVAIGRSPGRKDEAALAVFDRATGQLVDQKTFALPDGAPLFGAKVGEVFDAMSLGRPTLAVNVASFPPGVEPSPETLQTTSVPLTPARRQPPPEVSPVPRTPARPRTERVTTTSAAAPQREDATEAVGALVRQAARGPVPSSAWSKLNAQQTLDIGTRTKLMRFGETAVLVDGDGAMPSKVLPWPAKDMHAIGTGFVALSTESEWSRQRSTLVFPVSGLDAAKPLVLKGGSDPYVTPDAQYRFDGATLVRLPLNGGAVQRSAQAYDTRDPQIGGTPVLAYDPATKTLAVLEPTKNRVVLLDPVTLAERVTVPLPDDDRRGYALERLTDGQLAVRAHERDFVAKDRVYRLDLAARQVTGIKNEPDADFTDPKAVPAAATLKLRPASLHPALQKALAPYTQPTGEVRQQTMAHRDVGMLMPLSLAALNFKMSNAEDGNSVTTRFERFEAFLPVADTLWRKADAGQYRRGDTVDVALARSWLQELATDGAKPGAQAEQRVNGNHELRLEMALVAGGDAVLPEIDALLASVRARPPEVTKALYPDVLTEASIDSALRDYGGPQALAKVAERSAAQLKAARITRDPVSNQQEPHYEIRSWGELASLAKRLTKENPAFEKSFAPFFAAIPSATSEEQKLKESLLYQYERA